jgi:phosphopantothenoylcysteine synthetase/decarboxylase
MAAAVADYTPTKPSRRKLKRLAAELAVRLKPTTDILAELSRRRRPGQRVIGFALEDRAVRLNAARKLRDKRLDAIVLNRPAAIAAARCELEWLAAGGTWRVLPEASKARQAAQIVRLLEGLRPRGK